METKTFKGIDAEVDYRKIADAQDFYGKKEYAQIKVPWIISQEPYKVTGSSYPEIKSSLGYHVASAEQSFLELILQDYLPLGKFQATTPCFRDEAVTEYSEKWFLKVELIHYLGKDFLGESESLIQGVLQDAKEFFERYTPVKIVKTEIGYDLFTMGDVEVGSYGLRSYKGFSWIYGTGVAEPRFSYYLKKQKKGYHLRDIPKGKLGSETKIYEEMEEFKDALEQNNPVMGLVELSDLFGAVDKYLESRFKGAITLNDLLTMKAATERAFANMKRV